MKSYVKLTLFAVPIMAAAAYFGWQQWGARADTNLPVVTQAVVTGDIEDTVSAVGALQPLDYVDVGTNVSGQLKTLTVQVGDSVKEGQLLAEIDPATYEAKVAGDHAQIGNYQAQIGERTAARKLAEAQMRRQKQLLDARATSQDAYDTAAASYEQTGAQIKALESQIKQTQATLAADQFNLDKTKISAPIEGVVISLTAKRGQTLNSNQSAATILRIADLDPMTVWTQVSEADVSKLKVGMPAYFTTLGQTSRRWTGKLRQILPTPETVNNVILYNALFDVENGDGALLPQMSAQVFFVLAQAKGVTLAPLSALRRVPGRGPERYTARVMENGAPVVREVEIGVVNRLQAEIKSGLKPGDEVILDAPAGGRPGGQRRS